MKPYLIIIALIFTCVPCIKSQRVIDPDSLIGTWKYKGPSQISINDTIELEKGTLKDKNYELWTFKPYRNRWEITVTTKSKEYKAITATRIESWFYNIDTEILTLKKGDHKNEFIILSFKQQRLKLIRIK